MRAENTPVLRTERLLLRKFTDEDTDSIFSLFGDEKDIPVVFRMYQLNLDGADRTYTGYREKYPWFVEEDL